MIEVKDLEILWDLESLFFQISNLIKSISYESFRNAGEKIRTQI